MDMAWQADGSRVSQAAGTQVKLQSHNRPITFGIREAPWKIWSHHRK